MTAPDTPPPDDSGPDAIRRNFHAIAAATETPAPGDGSRLPAVNLSQPISALARTVGMICHSAPIFRFGESIATVDESGRIGGMTAERFPSWVENWLGFTRPANDAPKVESIGKDLAGKIMAADQFRDQLRELKAVSAVRLPVWRGEGEAPRVELAPEGFDPATGLFTVNGIPYQDDMTADAAWGILWDCLKEFPFDPEGESVVKRRRSFAVQVAAMLGVFCHALFGESTARPMIVFNANQPRAGKSLLMRLTLSPVHDLPDELGKSESESEFEKVLEAAAKARSHYLALDDLSNLRSTALNRFVTATNHRFRKMHTQDFGRAPNVTQVFATGNSLTLTKDLEDRALVVDLFEPGEANERVFKKPITTEWLGNKANRSHLLAALWALVRRWRDAGMPRSEKVRPSFEEWSGVIGGIMMACGMANPFTPRKAEIGGDEASRALNLVIGSMVGEAPQALPPILTTGEILDRAEADGMLEVIVGFAKEPKKSLGWRLKKLKGRHLIDSQRRAFEFGRRELSAGASYAIRFL